MNPDIPVPSLDPLGPDPGGDGGIRNDTPTDAPTPAELGLGHDDKIEQAFNAKGNDQPTPSNEGLPEEDVIGAALRRGRPARALDNLDEKEQAWFKNMSREAYDALYPFYTKFKGKDKDLDELPTLREKLTQLEKQTPRPASYYDSEDAYLLSKEYQEGLAERSNLQSLSDFWEQQLVAIEEGKPFRGLTRGPDGSLSPTDPMDPNPRAKAQVYANLAEVRQALATHNEKLGAIKARQSEQYKSYKTGLENVYNTIFGKYKDQLGPLAQKELTQFPEFVRDRPETNLMAHALALLKHIVATDKQGNQQAKVQAANKIGARSAGPTMRQLQTAPREQKPTFDEQEYKFFKAKGYIPT